MQREKFNLDREFVKWFFEETYPEMGSNRCQVYMYGNPGNKDNRDYWMQQAFEAGAESMWNEINYTLLQYAAAAEGLEPELVEPCEIFDRARENLHSYIHQQLRLF
jgi:hypothetical protein